MRVGAADRGRLPAERHHDSAGAPPSDTSDLGLTGRRGARSVGRPPLPPRRWRDSLAFDVFASDGRYLGTVPKPRNAEFLTMRGDTIWGTLRDSLDVAYVARWRVEPGLGGGR